jgi:hypothetical protein
VLKAATNHANGGLNGSNFFLLSTEMLTVADGALIGIRSQIMPNQVEPQNA